MKKILTLLTTVILAASIAACATAETASSTPDPTPEPTPEVVNLEGEIPDLIMEVIENADIDPDFKEMLKTATSTMEITEENQVYALGEGEYEFVEGYVTEPMMSSQAFSLVMIRAEDEAAAETLAEGIATTVDPIKWVCVSVEPDDVQTSTIGDMMFLIMSQDSEKFIESFDALAE